MQPYSYYEIASDLVLWDEYINNFGELTDDQFRAMTIEQRIAMITRAYGPERKHDADFRSITTHPLPSAATAGSAQRA